MNDLVTSPAALSPAAPLTAPPAAPSITPALAINIAALTERQAAMTGAQYRERLALIEAFDKEVAAGGDGSIALGKTPQEARSEEIVASVRPSPEVQPGVHAPEAYTREAYGMFLDPAEAYAFGEAASAAGLDPDLVGSAMHSIRNDRAIAEAVAGGDDAIDAHLEGVKAFFGKLPGGSERLKLAVGYLNALAEKNPSIGDTVNAALMSPDALSMIAYHAEQAGFRPPSRR